MYQPVRSNTSIKILNSSQIPTVENIPGKQTFKKMSFITSAGPHVHMEKASLPLCFLGP